MNVSKNAMYSWSTPLTNIDGTPLTDLTSYTIKLGSTSTNYDKIAKGIEGSSVGLLTAFPGLASGTYFAVIIAVNSVGYESSPSNEISFTLIQETPSASASFAIIG